MSNFCEPVATKTDWETPQWLYDSLDDEFHFTIDVCANSENHKHKYFYESNSLTREWSGVCWMNPPYGKEIGKWVWKAYHSASLKLATVVCLLPVRSNCEWWKYVIFGEVRFIRKKLKFVGAPSVSMFPNALVIFHCGLRPSGVMKIWKWPE